MGGKSHGPKRGTRKISRGPEKLTVNRMFRKFNIGDKIMIKIASNSNRGQPFRRFNRKMGTIIGQRGAAYFVEVYDGDKLKKVIASPEHMKPA